MKTLRNLFFILSLALLASACGASKTSHNGKNANTSAASQTTAAAGQRLTESYAALTGPYKDWQTLEMPIKVNISSPMNFSCSARMQMIRGKWLGISVRMLGFEVAYLTADTDSVHAYVKVQKRYVSESIASLFASSGYNLANVQDLLLGRLFVPGGATATAADAARFKMERADDLLLLFPADTTMAGEIGFAAALPSNRLITTTCKAGNHRGAVIYTPASTVTPAGPVAKQTQLTADLGGNLDATLEYDLGGARWNRNVTPRVWKVPAGARRIKVSADLLKSLVGL